MRVIWSPAALNEVDRILAYLLNFNPRAAEDVALALLETGNGLVNFPYRGRAVRGKEVREVICEYPYIIRYRITGDTVRILRVRHMARRPTSP
jgi:toxin ParE1/3/4